MTSRIAIIDVGTNSVLMLITEKKASGQLIDRAQYAETTRLGRHIYRTGSIGKQGLHDTIHALLRYKSLAESHNVDRLVTVGTQVFRLAKNQKKICSTIRQKTGLSVEILSENKEAEYSYQGAVSGKHPDALVIDIGGGSTELIRGGRSGIRDWISLPIGAVVLTENFLTDDPPKIETCQRVQDQIIKIIPENWKNHLNDTPQIICVGGTITTLAALHLQLKIYDADRVDGQILSVKQIRDWMNRLCAIHLNERQKVLQTDPKRADIIIAGILILLTFIEMSSSGIVYVSQRGLRHGIALREYGLHAHDAYDFIS